jgi:hypothetical protein
MEIILDGVAVDSGVFSRINIANIQSIEVLTELSRTAVYGSGGANAGVLIITSKRGGENPAVLPAAEGMIHFSPKGYDISREFYSPVYRPGDAAIAHDHRSTIYWNPNVITDENGRASVNYFNAGDAGTYRVVVEGMDMSGNLTHAVYTYEVK